MFKTCLENHIARRKSGYKCYLCNVQIEENNLIAIREHIERVTHQQRTNEIDTATKDTRSNKLETLSENKRRKIVCNLITWDKQHVSSLYCHLCDCRISGLSNTLEHIEGFGHKTVCTKLDNNDTQNLEMPVNSSKHQESNIQNKMNHSFKNDCFTYNAKAKLYKCTICNVEFSDGMENLLRHAESSFHKSIAALDKKTINSLVNKSDNVAVQNNKNCFTKIRYCHSCQIHLKNSTILQFHCMIHLYREIDIPPNIDIIQFKFRNGEPIIKCLLCNTFISENNNLYTHFSSTLHLDRLKFYTLVKDDVLVVDIQVNKPILERLKFNPSHHISKALICTLCDVPVLAAANVNDHEKGKKHQTKVLEHLQSTTEKLNNENSIPDFSNFYICYICEMSFLNAVQLFDHYKEKAHKLKITCFNLINKNVYLTFVAGNDKQTVRCKLCNTYMISCRDAIQHIWGKKHLGEAAICLPANKSSDKVQSINNNKILTLKTTTTNVEPVKSKKVESSDVKMKNKFETSKEELLKLGFSLENIHPDKAVASNSLDMDDILNKLIPLTLTNSQQKKLASRTSRTRRPRVQNNESNKAISFSQNVHNWGKMYIKKCISSGTQNIYNMNPEKFRLLKLGTTLIFPWDSEKACIVCGEHLTDKQIVFEHLQNEKHIENLLQMEEHSKEFEDFNDQFSDLDLAKNYMQEESDDWVYCYACKRNVKNDDMCIHLHTEELDHINKSQLWKRQSDKMYEEFSDIFKEVWYYAQVFICDICQIRKDMEIDFIIHLESQKHFENVEKFLQKGNIGRFGMCPACITYWYAGSEFYSIHCEDHYHRRFAKNGDFTVPDMTVIALDLVNNVNEQIKFLSNESNRTVLEKYKETELLKCIEETVETIYPHAKAYTFGSRLSHLGFVDSDVDVFLDCDNLYYNGTTHERSQRYLISVKKNFEIQPNIWIVDEVLLVTRIPILKLRHIPTGLKCDISFINGLSVEKSKLIGFYNAAYPICRELILYMKKWLSLCRITGSDCITTFAISWYVIFYLQVKGILPSVYDLIRLENKSKIIDGWECGFLNNFSANHSELSCREQLKGFFTYYAEFNYKEDVACPYLGKIIKKHTFAQEDLPEEMEIYKCRLQKDPLQIFRFDSPMCIQDPIDLSQNITKAVKKNQLRCFRQYCTNSAVKC